MGRKNIQQVRRLQIIKALNRCLLKKPYKDTTVKDIALEAGINHGMLHYYFKDKEEILLNYVDYVLSKHKNDFLTWRESESFENLTQKQTFEKVFHYMNEKITLNINLSKVFVILWEISLNNRKVKSMIKKVYQEWVEVTIETLQYSSTADTVSKQSILSIIAYLEGMSMLSTIMNLKKPETREMLETFEMIIAKGLFTEARKDV